MAMFKSMASDGYDDPSGLYTGYNIEEGDTFFSAAGSAGDGIHEFGGRGSTDLGASGRPSGMLRTGSVTSSRLNSGRPVTSIKAAGFISQWGLNRTRSGNRVDSGVTNNSPSVAEGDLFVSSNSEQHIRMRKMEQTVDRLVTESCLASGRKDFSTALDKAKEADREHQHCVKMKRELLQALQSQYAASGADPVHQQRQQLLLQQHAESIDSQTFLVIFNLCVQYTNNKMYDEALRKYEAVPRTFGSPPVQVRINVGNIYFAQGNYHRALKLYKMALDQVPGQSLRLKMRLVGNVAVTYCKLRQYEDALRSFNDIMRYEPTFRVAFSVLLCHCVLGSAPADLKEAFNDLIAVRLPVESDEKYKTHADSDRSHEQLLEVIRNDDLRRLEKAMRTEAEQNILLATKIIAPLVLQTPRDGYEWCINQVKNSTLFSNLATQLQIDMAIAFLRQNDFTHAIEVIRSFDKCSGEALSGTAAANLAFLYGLTCDDLHTRSGTQFRKTSSTVNTAVNGGTFDSIMSQPPTDWGRVPAERCADLAVRLDHYNPAALVCMGNALFARGDVERARHYYFEAVQVDSSCIEAYYNLGLAHKRLKFYDEALACFKKLMTIVRNNAQVMFQIADLYELTADKEQAVEWFIQVLGAVPTDAGILRRLGDLYDAEDDISQAFHYYYESYRYNPNQLNVLYWLGVYYGNTKCFEKACNMFEKGGLLQPNDIHWPLMKISCLRHTGWYQSALELCRQTHKRFPDNAQCLTALISLCTELNLPQQEITSYAEKLRRIENIDKLQKRRKQTSEYVGVASYDKNKEKEASSADYEDPLAEMGSNSSDNCLTRPAARRRPTETPEALDFSNETIGDDLLPE